MIADLPPGLLLILGSFLALALPRRVRSAWMVLLPALGLAHLFTLHHGEWGQVTIFGMPLTLVRIDKLSFVFGVIFHICAFLGAVFALHLKDDLQHVAAQVYAGAAIAAVFAGDLVTLFVYWEIAAVASVFLIWSRRTARSESAGLRYLVIQVGSGVLLLAGTLLHYRQTGSVAFGTLGLSEPGTVLIFIAFGIKCAFPLLHNWLQDAYPESTATGAVFLSAFTTKLAVYALARGYPGTPMLIWIGATMTVFPIFYAVIENDLRRVLAYSLNNQLGFMVCAIGVGTPLALNGAVGHAFAHLLYKSLLFMSMGAVLHRAGTVKASELGGLYKSMPWTTFFCIIGAASISAFPLFSGFVTKSMTLSAAAAEGHVATWFALLFASAGVLHHSGIKIPFYGFFGKDTGFRCQEAPANMLVAMGVTAALCIGIGVHPKPLYDLLPHPVEFQPYTPSHVVGQLQLLVFAALGFAILKRTHIEPPELKSVNLDSDWTYRRLGPLVGRTIVIPMAQAYARLQSALAQRLVLLLPIGARPAERRAMWTVAGSTSVILSAMLLAVYLLVFFWRLPGR